VASRAVVWGTVVWGTVSLGALVLSTVPAQAESASEVQGLVGQARSDPAALTRLMQVKDVDGRPVDFQAALAGASGDDLARRLDALDAGPSGAPVVEGQASRQAAEHILAGRRYQPRKPPRPLQGAIHQLGRWLEPVLRPLGRFLAPVGRLLLAVYRNAFLMGLVGLLVVALAALAAVRLSRRRLRAGVARGGQAAAMQRLDPKDLDAQADQAEARGELERALRLRFLAGLIRLDRAGALDYKPSLTTNELVRAIRSSTFPRLAGTFDEVVYGGRPPGPDDLSRAKADWPRVLEEARR
jgi:hypothetical protein